MKVSTPRAMDTEDKYCSGCGKQVPHFRHREPGSTYDVWRCVKHNGKDLDGPDNGVASYTTFSPREVSRLLSVRRQFTHVEW
jgi:hypothetical protein